MKNLLNSILNVFTPKYNLVYKNAKGDTQLYTVRGKLDRKEQFDNSKEGRSNVGFRTHVVGKGVRSFRYDRIVSIVKG